MWSVQKKFRQIYRDSNVPNTPLYLTVSRNQSFVSVHNPVTRSQNTSGWRHLCRTARVGSGCWARQEAAGSAKGRRHRDSSNCGAPTTQAPSESHDPKQCCFSPASPYCSSTEGNVPVSGPSLLPPSSSHTSAATSAPPPCYALPFMAPGFTPGPPWQELPQHP